MKLSVIIPVYNVENYVRASAGSVLNQDFRDLELILVDDGSTDGSGKLCDEIALSDRRVKVIHKTNGGVSDARNAGIKAAEGEYISFLDGDDLYAGGTLAGITELISQKEPDVVIGRFRTFSEDGTRQIEDPPLDFEPAYPLTGEELLKNLIKRRDFLYIACRYFLKREFILRNGLFFEKGIYHEDEYWTPVMLSRAQNISVYPEIFYLYRVRSNTISTAKSLKRTLDKLFIIGELYKIKSALSEGTVYRQFFDFRINSLFADVIGECPGYNMKEVKTIAKRAGEITGQSPDLIPVTVIGNYCRVCGVRYGIILFAMSVKLKRMLRGKKPTW